MRISDCSSDVCYSDLAALFEDELGGLAAAKPHLRQLLCDLEPRRVGLDDESRYALGTGRHVRLGVDKDGVGDRTVGDIDLAAVQDIIVAIAPRGREIGRAHV